MKCDDTFSLVCNIPLMGNHHNGHACGIERLKQLHNFLTVMAVETAGRLIGNQNLWAIN